MSTGNLTCVYLTGDGSTTHYPITIAGEDIGYLSDEDIVVYVDGVEVSSYIEAATPHIVILNTAPVEGAEVLIRREVSDVSTFTDFERGNPFSKKRINGGFTQQLYLTQEILDGFVRDGFYYKQDVNFGGYKVTNLGEGTDDTDAVNKAQLDVVDDRLAIVETSLGDGSLRYLPWVYTATGGELTLTPPYTFKAVATLAINGIDQVPSQAWSYNYTTSANTINLAEALSEGDVVCARIGGEPEVLSGTILTDTSLIAIARANNVDTSKVALLELATVTGVQYLYDPSNEKVYYSNTVLTGNITSILAASNGVRSVVCSSVTYEVSEVRLTAVDYGFILDGITDNAALVTSLDASYSSLEIDLNGGTVYTSILPSNLVFTNGYINYSGTTVVADNSAAMLSGPTDSGGLQLAYSGGVEATPTAAGRTNKNMNVVLGSQNCRSEKFPRSVNIGSIYSWAYGNVSGNYSSRQCVAAAPQTVNIASEECQAYGFRGANIASQYTFAQESASNISSRYSYANSPRSANIASVNASTGEGGKARLSVTVSSGVVTAVTVNDGGVNYINGSSLVFYDRTSSGTGAVATITVDGSGTITSVTVSNGGSGYSDIVDAVVDCDGDYSANIATTNACVTSAEASANLASNSSKARGVRSGNVATSECIASGATSANIASTISTASGTSSANIASTGCVASGILSATIAANNCIASADGSVSLGRRTLNNVTRSIAFGDASSGSAATANRKFHLYSNGSASMSGTLTQSATFTDIAKMFENEVEGVEIPIGSLVCIDGRKVRLATKGDNYKLLSAHSRTYVQLLGDSTFTWSGRYQRDEFGQVLQGAVWDEDLQEYVTEALESEGYSSELEQVPRSERTTEWTPVALLGEVFIRVDSTVTDGCFVGAGDIEGLGTSCVDGLYCMSVTTPYESIKGYAVALCLIK